MNEAWIIKDWYGEVIIKILIGTLSQAEQWMADHPDNLYGVHKPNQLHGPYPMETL